MSVVREARPRACIFVLAAALVLAPMVLERPAEAADSGSISGLVTDRDGQPVAGVTVEVGALSSPDTTVLSTDDDGRFAAEGLLAGSYAVCFYADGQDLARECWMDYEMGRGFTRVEVTNGESVSGINAELLPASYLRGTVTDTRGVPVEGAQVGKKWYFEDHYSWDEPVLTAADGSFEIGPVSSGEYTLGFSDTWQNRYATEWWDDEPAAEAATRIQVVRGESVDGLDAELADLAHISGRVTGPDGSSASGARVRVFKVTPSHDYIEIGSGGALGGGGRYEIALQPGTYRLEFDAAPGMYRTEYWDNARSVETARDVVIGAKSVTDRDAVLAVAPPVQLTRRPTISGRARVGETLTAGRGEWDVASLRFAYQWLADGSVIPRATGRRLLLTPRLRGKHIKVRVTATATTRERSPGSATTRRTQAVAPAPR